MDADAWRFKYTNFDRFFRLNLGHLDHHLSLREEPREVVFIRVNFFYKFVMIILHIGYCDGRLYLWGENIESSLPPKQTGVFGATLQDIRKAVRVTRLKLNDTTITAWLPTNRLGPIPSTTTQTDDKIEMSPWRITAIPLWVL